VQATSVIRWLRKALTHAQLRLVGVRETERDKLINKFELFLLCNDSNLLVTITREVVLDAPDVARLACTA